MGLVIIIGFLILCAGLIALSRYYGGSSRSNHYSYNGPHCHGHDGYYPHHHHGWGHHHHHGRHHGTWFGPSRHRTVHHETTYSNASHARGDVQGQVPAAPMGQFSSMR